MRQFALVLALIPPLTFAGQPKSCVDPEDAGRYLNKDICVSAHIYDIVQLPDGTRFLDVCPPETPDASYQFTIVSHREDSNEVGELDRYRDADVQVRGIVSRYTDARGWS